MGQSELDLDLNSLKEVAKSNLCEGAFYLPQMKSGTMVSKNHLSKEDNIKEYLPHCTMSNSTTSLDSFDTTLEIDMCLNTLKQSLNLENLESTHHEFRNSNKFEIPVGSRLKGNGDVFQCRGESTNNDMDNMSEVTFPSSEV